ncbi:hypothetical protein [Microbacterium sp.]|uniref:hypothetical protein n=1 Tax=Microbacterium sp. TaxID=51671 RepID=UPI002811F82F|nr:hypothetical protein [Microbacterium sp.]
MTFVARPTPPSVPEGARELGAAPHLEPGEVVEWHYRKPGWREGDASNIAPMRVVRDDGEFAGWYVNLENAHLRTGAAIASFRAHHWPFHREWCDWRPDPSWTIAELTNPVPEWRS